MGRLRREFDRWRATARRGVTLRHALGFRGVWWGFAKHLPFSRRRDYVQCLLDRMLSMRGRIMVVQIGAHVGNNVNDPVYRFLTRHARSDAHGLTPCRAVVIEPVRHLFEQLAANYSGCPGVSCENVAITDKCETRELYRLREGVDLAAAGMPAWLSQIGSLLPDRFDAMWDRYERNPEYKKFLAQNAVVERVTCVPLQHLLDKHRVEHVDLLQIDTEGFDYQIIRSIDFARTKPDVINYERVHLGKDQAACRALLAENGYRCHDHGQDTLCVQPGIC